MKMKKYFCFLMVMTIMSFAGVVDPFKQFTQADYKDYEKPGQNWSKADMFTLSVKKGSDVWLSNYVRSWYEPIADLHGNIYDMGAMKYGYIFKDDLESATLANGSYTDKIHWSNGNTNEITYFDNANPSRTNTATGYFLDYFAEDAEIYLVMTTLDEDGHETVDTYQYVQDADHDTTMVSRQHNIYDLANNVRVNFGIDSFTNGLIGREFVAVYDDTAYLTHGGAAGGPLPGTLVSCLLIAGVISGASKFRKR